MNFDQAFEKLIGHEGGYVSPEDAIKRKDPGGETKFGISKRSYPDVDIKNLTIDQAKAIYRRDFWAAIRCDDLPEKVRFQLFDTAVNSGAGQAIKLLQRAACVTADGLIGPQTRTALAAMPADRLVARFNAFRLAFMTGLPNWPQNSRGWALRIADNLLES